MSDKNEASQNPVELFGMHVAHVGINAQNPQEAKEMADLFATLMGLPTIDAAEKWFAERGFEINEESRALNPDGSTKLVYFKREIGGFAIHLSQD